MADDESQVVKLFARKLRMAGYEVLGVSSGNAAMSALRSVTFDLLILDLDMPDIDGFDVLKTIRTEMPDLPVLVVSGYIQGALLEAATCLGAVATLSKVTAPESLVDTVRELLALSEAKSP